VCKGKPTGPARKHLATAEVRRALGRRRRRDLLAILQLVEELVYSRDWNGLTELFSNE
jgi:hypothetical protein